MSGIPESILEYISGFSFRGNTKLRPAGANVEYTQEMLEEYKKCSKDPIYFIKKYIHVTHPDKGVIKFDLYDYQERMIEAYHNNRKVIFLTARQQGKCNSYNTCVIIRQKSTGVEFKLKMGDFHVWQKFKKLSCEEGMQLLFK